MKLMKYQILQSEINHGTEENPDIEPILLPHERYSDDANFERSYAIALKEAYNGEVTVEEVADPELTVEEQIAALKEQLSATDYKIIKCSEASLVGEELPYDITALHAERQAIREQINALEGA